MAHDGVKNVIYSHIYRGVQANLVLNMLIINDFKFWLNWFLRF